METYRDRLQEAVLDLCWSLWTELGVPGWQRRHEDVELDLEPLIVFTASIAERDPRLRDEVARWCVSNSRWISATRLRNFTRDDAGAAQELITRRVVPGVPRSPDLSRPALLQLRLRGLFGVSARAEIIRLLLREPGAACSASELAPEAGSSKRNIADALEALAMAGLLEAMPIGNRIRYRLSKVTELEGLVGDRPAESPSWMSRFRVLRGMLLLADATEGVAPIVGAVEAARLLSDADGDLRITGARPPQVTGEGLWESFRSWSVDLAASWARV
jgi:DNA-binding transcriptional ArsR family regulator